jgi:hypothetical protein
MSLFMPKARRSFSSVFLEPSLPPDPRSRSPATRRNKTLSALLVSTK